MTTTAQDEQKFRITGMDCADCAVTLERGVAQLDGVEHVKVNFTTATLVVSGDLDAEALSKRVEALGYAIASEDEADEEAAATSRGGVLGFFRYLLSDRGTAIALIGVVLMLATVPLSLIEGPPWLRPLIRAVHVIVIGLAGFPIARQGIRSLFYARQITIDLLMTIATLGALFIGETGEAATVVLLFSIGEALEGYTAERSRDALRSLLSLKPDQATVMRPCIDCEEHMGQEGYTGGPCPFCGVHEVVLPVEEVRIGDTVIVRPGERLPVDGRIISGASSINQAPITGESMPVARSVGDEVFAGTINGEGALEIEVTRLAADSTISRIVRLVEQAQSQRAPVERLVDRFARWYTPSVVIFAIFLAVVPPLLFGAPFFDTPDGTRGWLYRALALLIVACPCALVISTPVTMVSSLAGLARRGVLVKGGVFLDMLSKVKTFAFDKTGTLTEGRPVVRLVRTPTCSHNGDGASCTACDDLLALAAAVERRSEHPLAHAILTEAESRGLSHRYAAAEEVEALAGRGIRGIVEGRTITVGSHTLFHEEADRCDGLHDQIVAAEEAGQTTILVSREGEVLGFIAVADVPRPASREALRRLKEIEPAARTVMLTGDNPVVARSIAAWLGYLDEVRAGLLPEEKVTAVEELKEQYGGVVMVGDGINDAPALAAATVGVAMGGAGSAQAMETADVILMQDDLTRLPDVVQTSRRTSQVIWQNIIFSLAVKAVFLVLTLPGLATMWMAVFADMGASLLVTLNGMRMLKAPNLVEMVSRMEAEQGE
ncbi:MAG TPA: cation-translocating P-type ATPase [Chloroflexi bacterium]|nr:cation-translocating P-type ATPase [Chloroflexota bacterium]